MTPARKLKQLREIYLGTVPGTLEEIIELLGLPPLSYGATELDEEVEGPRGRRFKKGPGPTAEYLAARAEWYRQVQLFRETGQQPDWEKYWKDKPAVSPERLRRLYRREP